MDTSRLVKWVVAIAVVFVIWKYGVPWFKQRFSPASTVNAIAADNSCIAAANRASDAWGSGIGRFANPPYDLDAWSTFSGGVRSDIDAAEAACNGSAESCLKVRDALHNLRALVADVDTAVRGGAPASDVVQRQSAIDAEFDVARELVRAGK